MKFEIKLLIPEQFKLSNIDDEMRLKIARAFAVPAEKLWLAGDKPKALYDTSTARANLLASQTLTKEAYENIINKYSRTRSVEDGFRDAILETLKQAGLHPDNVERVAFALASDIGTEAMMKLTLPQCADVEYLTQTFLRIYRDITNS
jgi:hypothetical protein